MKVSIFIKKTHYVLVCLLIVSVFSCQSDKSNNYEQKLPLDIINENYKEHLQQSISFLDSILISKSHKKAVQYYKESRRFFKYAEPIMGFADKENYKALNAPNILKVEEEDATDIKINKPFGFQVIEETLFETDTITTSLLEVVKKTKVRLQFIEKNAQLKFQDYHILWLIRESIARVAFTGITGFDSPVLEQSLTEAQYVYTSIASILKIYKSKFKTDKLYLAWLEEIKQSKEALNSDFVSFDRYAFIKNRAHNQLKLINQTKKDWKVTFPYALAFNKDINSFFSAETFNADFFSDYTNTNAYKVEEIALGKRLFNDKQLSANKMMSCATCHHKDKAFTDGKVVFEKQLRNTPTLPYAALQQRFFYDGRTGNLEGQIVDVVNNNNEFHSDLNGLETVIKKDSSYTNAFKTVYKGSITQHNIRKAIANYVRSLSLFNSKFDNNINGLEHTLTKNEIRGFNLFNGKAKCATCHFAPVFNGTVPPDFTETEFELLGVPTDTLQPTTINKDLGRYNVFNTRQRKHFFKTPTIRNINKTAPYMHNGVYTNLNQVMTFYNDGGGAGLGLNLEYQTLPSDALNLSQTEINAVIAFLKTLDDN